MALLAVGWLALPLLPMPDGLEDPVDAHPSTEWTDRHGVTLRWSASSDDSGLTASLAESEIPETIIRTTLAAEDARFYSHPGVDVAATLRAAWQWLRHGRVISGGSTLTQQLIKLGHPRPRTLRTKVIEAVMALRLERSWDKQRILRAYLARIDYGNRCLGLAAASRHYFGKGPGELDWAEAALLAGIPQAPTRLNPRLQMERAQRRQRWILQRCVRLGWRTMDEAVRDSFRSVGLRPVTPDFQAPHLVDLAQRLDPKASGRVATTMDLRVQKTCEEAVRRHLVTLRDRQVRDAAVVVIDNSDGSVLAWVGSPDWYRAVDGQVNGPIARRSPGSALKPFAYLLGFERGVTAADVLADIPSEFATSTGIFRPENYDRHFRGPVSVREALAGSLNVPAVRLLERLGGPGPLRQRLIELGVGTLDRSENHYGLGLVLGDAEVRLIDLANAYATLARQGWHRPWRIRPGPLGPPIRVAEPAACWLVGDILRDPVARSAQFGLETPLRMGFPLACKTGTSSGFRDNWAFGFTSSHTVGVWVGNFDGSPMRDVSGVDGAAPILQDVACFLHDTFGSAAIPEPLGCRRILVEPLTGKAVPKGVSGREEVFLPGTRPVSEEARDRDSQGRIRLGPEYAHWWSSPDQRLAQRAVLDRGLMDSEFRILHPISGTVYRHDPDLPIDSQWIEVRATASCRWECDTLVVTSEAARTRVRVVPGRHQLIAKSAGGQTAAVWIDVQSR